VAGVSPAFPRSQPTRLPVEPVFLTQEQAISYAQGRACFRAGEIRVLDSNGNIERIIPFSESDRKL